MSNTKDCNLKMQLAHDYFMKHGDCSFIQQDVEQAWLYADLMFKQLEKREQKDLDCKYGENNKYVKYNTPCTSSVEGFTVNWDNLPEWAEWFAIDRDGSCYIYSYKPQIIDSYDYWADFDMVKNVDGGKAECIGSLNYPKDWKNTLTKRPSL